MTNASGAVLANREQRFTQFGSSRLNASGLPTNRRFNGMKEEATLGGIYDFNARFYDPAIGRFLSADTIVPRPSDPQSLNRFSFVVNNPLKYVDPSGHCSEWVDYALGAGYQFVNDMAFGIPNAVLGTGWQDEQSYSFQDGQGLGRDVSVALNVALAVDGTVKLAAGIAAMGPTAGGGTLCGAATGGVCLVPAGVALAAEAGLAGIGAAEGLVGGANLIVAKNNPLQGPRFSASNFRENLLNRTPIPKGLKNAEAHHVLPQALESRFKQLFPDLNIHDPKWGAWVQGDLHQRWSKAYQTVWEQWLAKNPNATLAQLEAQTAKLAGQFGYTWP